MSCSHLRRRILQHTVMGETSSDIGIAALQDIHRQLQIEDGNSVLNQRSFSWVAHRLRQTISASQPNLQRGSASSEVTVITSVVNDVQADTAQVVRDLVFGNATAVGHA